MYYVRRKLNNIDQWNRRYKLFYSFVTTRLNNLERLSSQPTLMFASQAGAYLSDAPFRCFILGQASGLTVEHSTRLGKPGTNTLVYYHQM